MRCAGAAQELRRLMPTTHHQLSERTEPVGDRHHWHESVGSDAASISSKRAMMAPRWRSLTAGTRRRTRREREQGEPVTDPTSERQERAHRAHLYAESMKAMSESAADLAGSERLESEACNVRSDSGCVDGTRAEACAQRPSAYQERVDVMRGPRSRGADGHVGLGSADKRALES